MKILYLTARQPYPVVKGDQIIAYEQIRELSKNNEVYLVTYADKDIEILKSEMNKYCKEILILNDNKFKSILSMSKSFFNLNSIQANQFYRISSKMKINKYFKKVCPEVVHVQSFRMAKYFMNYNGAKSIDLIDAYSLNMYKRFKQEKTVIKWLWNIEYKLLLKYENQILKKYRNKTIVAQRDKEYFKDDSIVVNPNGTSVNISEINKYIKTDGKSRDAIIFQGNMSYFPNVEAVTYIKNFLWDKIKKKNNNAYIYIVGGKPSNQIKEINQVDFKVTGYVKDMQEYLAKAYVAMYPIQSATGMQNKVLEAMAAGVPTIISKECLKGIPGLQHNINIIVAEHEDEYIEFYDKLINNEEYYLLIQSNALKFIEKNYTWEINVKKLINMWLERSK